MQYTATENQFKDKVILVTGAAEGIGACVAKAYAKYGATVVLLDKNIKALQQVYDDIESSGGTTPAILSARFKRCKCY